MAEKIRTRVLLLSDTHGNMPQPKSFTTSSFREPLPQADVAIHTGDLTMQGKVEEHLSALALLKSLPAPIKIVIPGNHDLTLDRPYYSTSGEDHGPRPKYDAVTLDEIRDLYTNSTARQHGIHYLEEGHETLTLPNRARLTVYGSAYTPEFCGWAFAYPHEVDRFNPDSPFSREPIRSYRADGGSTADRNIDILLTHGPPYHVLDTTFGHVPRDVGCPHLFRAVSRARPLLHCFGHIHEGWGALRKTWPTPHATDPSASIGPSEGRLCDPHQALRALQRAQDEDHAGTSWSSTSASAPAPAPQRIIIDEEQVACECAAVVDATDLRPGVETLFVNSSILNVHYRPVQAPFVVDLLLHRAPP